MEQNFYPKAWRPPTKKEWGPRRWTALHTLAIMFPSKPLRDDKIAALNRIKLIIVSLPCQECRMHAREYVTKHPPDLGSSEAFQIWMWNFHNAVNARLGKPQMPYDAYLAEYNEEICWSSWGEGCANSFRRARIS